MGNGSPIALSAFDRLLAWHRTYETVRPYQALGYKTPGQFYHHLLNTNATGKKVLSDIS